MEIKLIIAGQENYTGYCDQEGEKIFLGDTLEFTSWQGAVWRSKVIFQDGVITVSILDVECVKNPPGWKKDYPWTDSSWWGVHVGYGEYGTWNCSRKPLDQITKAFKTYEEYQEAEKKFVDKHNCYAHEQLFRPLPIKKII